MGQYQEAKKVALSYFDALEKAEPEQVLQVFREYMTEDYNWKGGGLKSISNLATTRKY